MNDNGCWMQGRWICVFNNFFMIWERIYVSILSYVSEKELGYERK